MANKPPYYHIPGQGPPSPVRDAQLAQLAKGRKKAASQTLVRQTAPQIALLTPLPVTTVETTLTIPYSDTAAADLPMGAASSAGTSADVSRADHTHSITFDAAVAPDFVFVDGPTYSVTSFGVVAYEFVPSYLTSSPGSSFPAFQWQHSYDNGSTWLGPDGTSATVYTSPTFVSGMSSGTLKARCRAIGGNGDVSAWVSSSNNAYVGPSGFGLTSTYGSIVPLLVGITPSAGANDPVKVPLPYSPIDGTTSLTWTLRRLEFRCETAPVTSPATVNVMLNGVNILASPQAIPAGASTATAITSFAVPTGTSGQLLQVAFGNVNSSDRWSLSLEVSALISTRADYICLVSGLTPSAGTNDAVSLTVPYSPTDGVSAVTWTMRRLDFRAETAPSGSAATTNILLNGSNILASDLSLSAGSNSVSTTTFATTTCTSGDLLKVHMGNVNSSDKWGLFLLLSGTF